jgi:serine protease
VNKFSILSGKETKVSNMNMRRILSFALGLGLILGSTVLLGSSSANAAVFSEPSYLGKPVVGLIIKYKEGVVPVDFMGNQVAIDAAGGKLTKGLDVGLGLYSASFAKPTDEKTALAIAATLTSDSRIQAVYLDHFLSSASFRAVSPKLAVLKASSAPTGLTIKDAWSSANPSSPKVTLNWKVPSKLNGGVIWGYRISKYDSASRTWFDLVSNTKSTHTSLSSSMFITAGESSKYKVAAITKTANSKYMAISAYSSTATGVATAIPQAPFLSSAGRITSATPVVTWSLQNKIDKGGLAVTYTVTATASDNSSATCTTSSTSCTLSGLQSGLNYGVQITATNARGSSTSAIVPETLDPMLDMQWYLSADHGINANDAWKVTKGSPSIVVAVIDTGITSHPDLDANVVTGYDFISNATNARDGNGRDGDPSDPGDWNTSKSESSSWHGTHVSGIIAAVSNSIGITGIAPNVKISPVRVLGANGGTEADIAAGINWAIGVSISGVPTNQYPAKVVNLSIGSSSTSSCYSNSATQLAIDESKKRNVTLVTAAGNDNHYASASYPGNCFGNITIGASGYYSDRAYYSNFSYYDSQRAVYIGVDISAPGGDDRAGSNLPADGEIWSTLNDGKTGPGQPTYGKEEGTSMASPVAAGVVALMYSVRPSLTDDQVWNILSSTAKPFDPSSECTAQMASATLTDGTVINTGLCGVGIIDAGAAVAAVVALNK